MDKKILVGTRQYELDEQSLLELQYYIVERPTNPDKPYYGIEIQQQKIHNGIKQVLEYKNLLLSESKEWVEELTNQFIGNGVTPMTMEYLIDDIMEIPC